MFINKFLPVIHPVHLLSIQSNISSKKGFDKAAMTKASTRMLEIARITIFEGDIKGIGDKR